MSLQAKQDKQTVVSMIKDQLTTYQYYISEYDKQCYIHVLRQFAEPEDFLKFCDKWNLYQD